MGQSGPMSNDKESVLPIPQSSRWFGAISWTLIGGGGLNPLQRCSRHILQPQLIGQRKRAPEILTVLAIHQAVL